jgi:hypothetical protein
MLFWGLADSYARIKMGNTRMISELKSFGNDFTTMQATPDVRTLRTCQSYHIHCSKDVNYKSSIR